jgi:hypothetical protein
MESASDRCPTTRTASTRTGYEGPQGSEGSQHAKYLMSMMLTTASRDALPLR